MTGLDSLQASAGYSFNAALGERARIELGVDWVNHHLYLVVYSKSSTGRQCMGRTGSQSWMPSPNASLFWVF